MAAVGRFFGGLLVIISTIVLLVLLAALTGLVAALMVTAFVLGWEVVG